MRHQFLNLLNHNQHKLNFHILIVADLKLFKKILSNLFGKKEARPRFDILRKMSENSLYGESECEKLAGAGMVRELANKYIDEGEFEEYLESALTFDFESRNILSEEQRKYLRIGAGMRNEFIKKCGMERDAKIENEKIKKEEKEEEAQEQKDISGRTRSY